MRESGWRDTGNQRGMEKVTRTEESGGGRDCGWGEAGGEGEKLAGSGSPRPRDAALHHSRPLSEDPETPATVPTPTPPAALDPEGALTLPTLPGSAPGS